MYPTTGDGTYWSPLTKKVKLANILVITVDGSSWHPGFETLFPWGREVRDQFQLVKRYTERWICKPDGTPLFLISREGTLKDEANFSANYPGIFFSPPDMLDFRRISTDARTLEDGSATKTPKISVWTFDHKTRLITRYVNGHRVGASGRGTISSSNNPWTSVIAGIEFDVSFDEILLYETGLEQISTLTAKRYAVDSSTWSQITQNYGDSDVIDTALRFDVLVFIDDPELWCDWEIVYDLYEW